MARKRTVSKKMMLATVLGMLVVLDVGYVVLSKQGYHIALLLRTGPIYPILFNLAVLTACVLAAKRRWPLIVIGFFLVPVLFYMWINPGRDHRYTHLESPRKTQGIIVEHWRATLGESRYSYRFYQIVHGTGGLLVKHLEDQNMAFIVRGVYDADQILGTDRPRWEHEKKVTFSSIEGDKRLLLE